jgi:hypothetical protein
MTKPSNFIKNTDFKSVGNDANTTITLNIPNSFSVAANGTAEWHTDVNIGTNNAPMMVQMIDSLLSSFTTPSPCISVKSTGANMTYQGTYYDLGEQWWSAYIYRLNATTVRLESVFTSQYPATVNVTGAAQTITAKIKTFLDPFVS